MQIICSPEIMQKTAGALRRAGKRVGLVPTMGFLHEGHLSLVDLAREQSDTVILSIFVNPAQFGPNEDLDRYPRDFERDTDLCRARGVDIVFNPEAGSMYSAGHAVYVEEARLSRMLCGASRPGHFRGVLTVVAKLFNLTLSDVAAFGQKDAQQARLIRQMVKDLDFPVRVLLGPIVREPDGLAMSSRNTYLSVPERRDALCLVEALKLARELYDRGERSPPAIIEQMAERIGRAGSAKVDYIEIVDLETYEPLSSMEKPAIILLAVRIGKTRLIDNLLLPDSRLSNLPCRRGE